MAPEIGKNGLTPDTAKWFGVDPSNSQNTYLLEQKQSMHVAADGVVTIVRRWVGAVDACMSFQTPIRTAMPAPTELFQTALDNSAAFPSANFTDGNFLCISSDVDPIEGKAELFMLTETYQGYIALPFSIYSWISSRLDLPIATHPNFDNGGETYEAMVQGENWQLAGQPLTFTGFPVYNVGGATSGSLNPYVGISEYPSATGIWKKVSFLAGEDDGSISKVNDAGAISSFFPITGKLWKMDPPDIGPWTHIGIPDINNTGEGLPTPANPPVGPDGYVTWIKSQEDLENIYRGASSVWQYTESWWANLGRGWLKSVYDYPTFTP